ncbi:MAG: chitobiase/beta-hexosaminidase C-terminal domain-containing protein, partial [Bacteroidales bacterium]|nr:chitobiase/beta-hexosaminidase C-terminal domain-containing protein [Bacteroidales bacterium]
NSKTVTITNKLDTDVITNTLDFKVQTYYTLDGNDPTTTPSETCILYSEPFTVDRNCTVKAISKAEGYDASIIAKYEVDAFKVATPTYSVDIATATVRLNCSESGARIYYILNPNEGDDPANGTAYPAEGLPFTNDMDIAFCAKKDYFNNSESVRAQIKRADYTCGAPAFVQDVDNNTYTDKAYGVTITSTTPDAVIWYTTDDTDPLTSGTEYAGKITVDGNCTLKAVATKDGKFANASELKIDNFKVATPKIDHVDVKDGKTGYLYFSCGTPGATIWYVRDGNTLQYESSKGIDFTSDMEGLRVYATKDCFIQSDTETMDIKVDNYKAKTPVINATKAADGRSYSVSIMAEDGKVWYTDNGNDPRFDTDNRKQYDGAFTVNRNCVINAYATMIDKFDSELAEPVQIDGLSVGDIDFHVENNVLTISSEGALAIYYEIDNENVTEQSKKYESPIILEENCKVYALAVCGEGLDSKTGNYTVDWFACDEVTVEGFNGRYLRLACNTKDATIYYKINDGEEQVYTGTEFDVQGLTKVTARVEKNKLNWHSDSLKTPYIVPCYYAGEAVYVKEKGNLEKAFEWCGGLTTDKTELTVIGNVNDVDLAFVKAKNWLQFLDMKEAQVVENRLPDEAFAGMSQLLCITLPDNFTSVGSRLLKGDSRLGAVIWNSTAAVPADLFDGVVHANALIYVSSPAIAANAPLRNRVVNGMADEIVLSDASSVEGNFYCPIEFKAKMITYEHAYGMKTEIGKCRGWEAISLPFDVQHIMHYDENRVSLGQREILPFAAAGNDDKPRFWLYSLDNEFTSASGIEANTPYIISMPYCEDYGNDYNLNGKVTFRSENVDVHPSQETHEGVQNAYRFVANTQYVAQCDTVMALNIYQDYQGNPEGSVFVKNWRAANPFEAYITSDDAEAMKAQMFRIDRYATAIDGWTAFAQRDIYSENGNLYINCQRDCVVRLYTTQGQLVRVLQLHAGLNEITGIARGIYLVNSVKIVVK